MNAQKLQNQFKSFNLEITQLEEFTDTIEFNYTLNHKTVSATLFFNVKTETVEQKLRDFFKSVKVGQKSRAQEVNELIKSVPGHQEKLAMAQHFKRIHALMAIHPELQIEDWEEVDSEEIEFFMNFQTVDNSVHCINTRAAHPNRTLNMLFKGSK